jgi:hypothetical protein
MRHPADLLNTVNIKPNFKCPACGFTVFNRRYPTCERCKAALPAGMAHSAWELAALTRHRAGSAASRTSPPENLAPLSGDPPVGVAWHVIDSETSCGDFTVDNHDGCSSE